MDFFYSGEIDISENNVQELLPVACLLQVQSVQKACCDFLERQLSTENCLGEFLYKSIISDMANILLALKKLAWESLSCRFVGMIETLDANMWVSCLMLRSLTLYTLTSECTFSILVSIHFQRG